LNDQRKWKDSSLDKARFPSTGDCFAALVMTSGISPQIITRSVNDEAISKVALSSDENPERKTECLEGADKE
jgi:hypothetical protein